MRLLRLMPVVCVLLCCGVVPAQQRAVVLQGTLLTPDEVIPHGEVLIRNGRIEAAGANVKIPTDAVTVDTGGLIAPGLIDLHNHLTWNVFPRWQPGRTFGNRYDWQQTPVYRIRMDAPHRALVAEGLQCDAERYAEVKAITEGETSVVGSLGQPCDRGLARNLDDPDATGLAGAPPILYNVFPLQMTEPELAAAGRALARGGSLLIHVAEGAPTDASAAREFGMVAGRGLLAPGVSFIHAVALTPEDFRAMAGAGVGFIWSPRSNIELYGQTANVAAAVAAHVLMALAPDWSPTGSEGSLGELQYAALWNATQPEPLFDDRTLAAMATANAARLVHLDRTLGRIAPGFAADLLVLRPLPHTPAGDAWWALDHASPEDVRLVMVGGNAIYGEPGLMRRLAAGRTETLEVCGAEKLLAFPAGAGDGFAETEARLRTALREQGQRLAPLAGCGS